MHTLETKIRNAMADERIAVIPFITAGFPERNSFWTHLEELVQAGSDIIEIGIPFSDPVADGPVVEDASRKVLEDGVNLSEILAGLKQRKNKFQAGIVLMGYFNPFLQYGFTKFAQDAAEAGVNGVIIPDLPYEEQERWQKILNEAGLALIPLVGLNTSSDRMKLYAQKATGYVYVVSVLGITGARDKIANGVGDTIKRAREAFNIPVALGFGLKRPEQLNELPADAKPDAAVFGSALLTHLARGKKVSEFLAPWFK